MFGINLRIINQEAEVWFTSLLCLLGVKSLKWDPLGVAIRQYKVTGDRGRPHERQ